MDTSIIPPKENKNESIAELTYYNKIGFIRKFILYGAILTIIDGLVNFIIVDDLYYKFLLLAYFMPIGIIGTIGGIGLGRQHPNALSYCKFYAWIYLCSNVFSSQMYILSGWRFSIPLIINLLIIIYGIIVLIKLYGSADIRTVYSANSMKTTNKGIALISICIALNALYCILWFKECIKEIIHSLSYAITTIL